jgi:hypothetical protein
MKKYNVLYIFCKQHTVKPVLCNQWNSEIWPHNTSYCSTEVVTKAGLTVSFFVALVILVSQSIILF